jgi:hypothetical protein
MLLIALVTSSASEIQILYSTLARMVRYWSIGFGFFFLCKACKLIFLAKEMEKPQLCYQIKKIFSVAQKGCAQGCKLCSRNS